MQAIFELSEASEDEKILQSFFWKEVSVIKREIFWQRNIYCEGGKVGRK